MTCLIRNVYGPFCKYTQGWINRGIYRLYNGKDIFNSDVILVFVAKYDWNGAYSHPSPVHIFRTLFNSGPTLVYKIVSSIEQINAFTFEQKMHGNRICGLWIKAHGKTNGIHLGKGYIHEATYHTYININYVQTDASLLLPTLNQLEPHAAIVIESCKTGQRNLNGCFAERIAQLCPNHSVYASESSVMGIGSDCRVENRTLVATFIDFRSSHTGIVGFLVDAVNFLVLNATLGYVGIDRTIIYRRS